MPAARARRRAEVAVTSTARFGFAARGVLYSILGVLAVRLALGETATDADQQGAMTVVAARPFGLLLLGTLTVGWFAYAVFRGVEAVRGRGDASAFERRLVPAVRCGVYLLLAGLGVQELVEARRDDLEASATATLLGFPGGRVVVAAVGLVLVGVGLRQLAHAITGDVHELSDAAAFGRVRGGVSHAIGRAGHLGRAVVFALAGGFLVRAVWRIDPDQGVGLDAALQELIDAPFGTPVLVVTAACLIAFGAHCVLEAVWPRTVGGPTSASTSSER